jgi:hypothetical protein
MDTCFAPLFSSLTTSGNLDAKPSLITIDSLFLMLTTSPNSWKLSAVRALGVSFKVFIFR